MSLSNTNNKASLSTSDSHKCGGSDSCDGDKDRHHLFRRSSKSRLSKQAEVESENPPEARLIAPPEVSVSAEPQQNAAGEFAATTAGDLPPQMKLVPETRVESYDFLDGDDPLSAALKSKMLVRSHAMCGDDDTKLNAKCLERFGSSKTSSQGSSLSRESSTDYTDSTGTNLEEFIISTLHKNLKDRNMLLELEQVLGEFVQEQSKNVHKFPQMSSYNRMLVHRVAAFFGLDHNVDQSGTAVVVNKNKMTRLPDVRFKDYIKHDNFSEDRRMLLARRNEQNNLDEMRNNLDTGFDKKKTRSLDEREEDYNRIRARIFNQDSTSSAEGGVTESPMSGYSSEGMMQSGARPWSSTDSGVEAGGGYLHRQQMMQKAGSFGGVSVLYRSDGPKLAPKRSNTGEGSRQLTIPEFGAPNLMAGQQVIFAVANIEQVPPGAMIINPQTGLPYYNADGTVYRYYNQLLPQIPGAPIQRPTTPVADQSMMAGQMQVVNLCSPGGSESSRTSPVFIPPPQGNQPQQAPVVTYMVQQPLPSDSNQSCPTNQTYVIPASAYIAPSSMQYQQQSMYYPTSPVLYTQAGGTAPSTQVSYTQASSVVYPVYYHQMAVANHVAPSMCPSTPGDEQPSSSPVITVTLSQQAPSIMPYSSHHPVVGYVPYESSVTSPNTEVTDEQQQLCALDGNGDVQSSQ